MITDEQRLVSATSRFGHAIPTYDDGTGSLWIHRDSMGISGIVRADTWETAYAICEDEFFPEANDTLAGLRSKYGFTREHVKIIRTIDGAEREAVARDYPRTVRPAPDGRANWEFVRWETREAPCADENGFMENELFQEAYGFRPNGPRTGGRDPIGHGIYARDLNGDSLDSLTPELVKALGITLCIENE